MFNWKDLPRPRGWRTGQTIFNFLAWCLEKGEVPQDLAGGRQGDAFNLPDEKWEKLWQVFLDEHRS